MATISTLNRANFQQPITRTGNDLTFGEVWNLQLSGAASPVEAESLVSALGVGNSYSWPRIGIDAHPDNSALKPTGFTVEHKGDQATNSFNITLTYTNDVSTINNAQRAVDATASYSYQAVDTIIEVDIDPINVKAIAASNGEAYFPKIQRKGTNIRIVVNRNETTYSPTATLSYQDKLNKNAMKIDGTYYAARTLLLESWTGKSAIDVDGSTYYQVQYQLLYDSDEHKITLIDAASGPDVNGTDPQLFNPTRGKAAKLDGAGVFMSRSRQNDPTDYETNDFYVHDEIDMRFLRL